MSENTNEENFSMDWYSIGKRIKDTRVKAGFGTQVALSKATGIRSQVISDLEALSVHDAKPKQPMTAENLSRIALACGVSMDYLIFGKQDKEKEWDTLYPYGECIVHMINQLGAEIRLHTEEYGHDDCFIYEPCLYVKIPMWCLNRAGKTIRVYGSSIKEPDYREHPLYKFSERMDYVSKAPYGTDKSLLREEARRAVNSLRGISTIPEIPSFSETDMESN